jgi:murein L,D-transpeptidase YcbB/YkuD
MAKDRPMSLSAGRLIVVRVWLRLLVVVGALASAACVTTEPPAPAVVPVPAAESEPAPNPYLSLLRSSGMETTVAKRGKFVLVNIPSYELVALQDGMPVLRSRVVVGRPATPTPELLSLMVAIRFNPAWWPTPSMIRNEGLHYMPPGPDNPLGRMMFDLDNDEAIYLHDTNEKPLFNRAQRALSHGCIRVQQARALAAWSLGVSEGEIDALVGQGSHSVAVPENIPVALVYFTKFPNEGGDAVSYADIYRHRQVAGSQ